ncbi:LLM class flavin-dependent oxidoreductase [Halopenitus sp. H-Gu1]|uniref:LLM class flavin-dependent oxidoreductase n=1 Tax=Halopenitus sp. H-Gu1 TaxID=3242697 RepID=UPI00359DCBB1
MDIGVCLFNGLQHPDDDRPLTAVYSDMTDLVATADDVGLDSAWVSAHHFTPEGYMSGLLPTLGAFAEATENITLGTSMLLAPLHDAIRVAEDAATVSLLSDGRLVLGMTNGYRDEEFKQFGVDKDDRALKTEEAVRIARGAWSDGPLGFNPRFHPATPEATVTPKPEDSPAITLGGTSKPAVRRAAMLADAWTAPETLPFEEVVKRVKYQRRLRKAEKLKGEFTTYVQRYCFVDESAESAWETFRDPVFYMQRKYDEYSADEPIDELSAERREHLKQQAIVGSPAEVIEQLERYQERLGDTVHMLLRPYVPGLETSAIEQSIERLGTEVAPALR